MDRSRGLLGLGLTVEVFPLDGWNVPEARVEPPVVVGVDPREDRPPRFGAGREPVAVHDLTLERRPERLCDSVVPAHRCARRTGSCRAR